MKKWKIVSIGLLLAFSFYQEVQAVVQSKNIKTVVESDSVKGEKKEVTVDKLKRPTAYERIISRIKYIKVLRVILLQSIK